MGHHKNKRGEFQSDKHPKLKPDHIILDFKDPIAQPVLWFYACLTNEQDLKEDIKDRLIDLGYKRERIKHSFAIFIILLFESSKKGKHEED